MSESILDNIASIEHSLPKKQKQLCRYIMEHQKQSGMMTVAELAKNANVGTTTVLRLAEMLGYTSYSDFKHTLMEEVITRSSSSYTRMIDSFDEKKQSNSSLSCLCADTLQSLPSLLTSENEKELQNAVQLILNARTVYILGCRGSSAFALYLSNALSTFMHNVRNLSFEQEYVYDRVFSIEPQDVLITVSVWPCTRRTVRAAEIAAKQKVPVILLTNTKINPIARVASSVIDTNSINQSNTDIMLMSICCALIQEIGIQTAPRSTEALSNLERELNENNIFLWRKDS